MTEYGAPFDGILTGDATVAPYSAAEWARLWMLRHGVGSVFPNYGIFAGTGGGTYAPLEVRAQAVVSANVDVQVGAALVDGRFYENTAVKTLTVNSNSAGNPRIDTVILRLDFTAQTIRLAIKQGTAAASPARPTLQQDASFWEMPLADIAVANGFTTLAQSTISQRGRTVQGSGYGWQPYAMPILFTHGVAYGAGITLNANGTAAIIPFVLGANMLLQSVSWRGSGSAGSVASTVGWDLYFQDVNDGNTAENTLRRVAKSNGTTSAGSGGIANNFSLDAETPTPLPPGAYWLIFQNRHATENYSLTALAASSFVPNVLRTKVYAVAGPGQTAEVVTSVSSVTSAAMIRLNGRVFGETALF